MRVLHNSGVPSAETWEENNEKPYYTDKTGWDAARETILDWDKTEGYPADAMFQDGKVKFNQVSEVYDTESLAKFAFSILWQAVEFAERERVPVILDF